MTAPLGYAFEEHTADIRIRAWGPDLGAALTQALRALSDLLTGGPVATAGQHHYTVDVTSPELEELVVLWLQELLVRFDIEHLVPVGCAFDALSPTRVRADIEAIRCDPQTQRLGREVKAITYHQLRVERNGGYTCHVIVDI